VVAEHGTEFAEYTENYYIIQTITIQFTSSMILERGFLKTRARLERPASCTKGFQFWCSASMLSFCMTVCCTDWWSYPILYLLFNFLISLRIICTDYRGF